MVSVFLNVVLIKNKFQKIPIQGLIPSRNLRMRDLSKQKYLLWLS